MNKKYINAPPEFDWEFYRLMNSDLAELEKEFLHYHFEKFGMSEGRLASAPAIRSEFIKLIPSDYDVLEIGPFGNPCLTGERVKYFDVLDYDELCSRGAIHGHAEERIPKKIHYVSPTGDLSIVNEKFDAIVSSHVIEHQIDLIRHLNDCGKILNEGGVYFVIVPDKRYCFDHFIAESTIADVINAHGEKRTNHSLRSVIEHRVLGTHNNPVLHWQGHHGSSFLPGIDCDRLQSAIDEYNNACGKYIDVHAWYFTPSTFRNIIDTLKSIGFIDFTVERCYYTPKFSLEFTAILRRS